MNRNRTSLWSVPLCLPHRPLLYVLKNISFDISTDGTQIRAVLLNGNGKFVKMPPVVRYIYQRVKTRTVNSSQQPDREPSSYTKLCFLNDALPCRQAKNLKSQLTAEYINGLFLFNVKRPTIVI